MISTNPSAVFSSRPCEIPIKIFFSERPGEPFDWKDQLAGPKNSDFRTHLFESQAERQKQKKVSKSQRYARCGCQPDGHQPAYFVVKNVRGGRGEEVALGIARFPKSGLDHAPHCPCRNDRLCFERQFEPATQLDNLPESKQSRGTDFAGLDANALDPELLRVSHNKSRQSYKPTNRPQRKPRKSVPSLRSLACRLLDESGICDWHPGFRSTRDAASLNGLVCRVVKSWTNSERDNKWTRLVKALAPTPIVPWSFFNPSFRSTNSISSGEPTVGFGFVSHLETPSPSGARLMVMQNYPQLKILLAPAVIKKAAKNPECPIDQPRLPFPIWVMFIAKEYNGVNKASSLVGFRFTAVGAIPVSSDYEDEMAMRLIREGRSFRRWIVSPGGISEIPDFQLMDTRLQHYIEVAGRMSDPKYARLILAKEKKFGAEKLKYWDTRRSLREFQVPDLDRPWINPKHNS